MTDPETLRLYVNHATAKPPPQEEAVSHRCACCGSVMPDKRAIVASKIAEAQLGDRIVAIVDDAAVLLCSRECEAQILKAGS